MTKIFLFAGILFSFTFRLQAQSYEVRLGPKIDVPWYYRLFYDHATPESLVFRGHNDYNNDPEFQNEEIIPVLTKKTYETTFHALDKTTLTLQKPLIYSKEYKSEKGEDYYMRVYHDQKEGDKIVFYGVGFSNEDDVYTWRKVINLDGQVVEDWKRIQKVFTIPEKSVVNYYVSGNAEGGEITVYYRKKSATDYYMTEFYKIEKDQTVTKIGQVEKMPKGIDNYALFQREGNFLYCFYRSGMGPYGFFVYDLAGNTMVKHIKNPVDFGKKYKQHPFVSYVDKEKGILYVAGGYEDKSNPRPKTDGLYAFAYDYRNGNPVNIQFTPFTGTIGIDNRGPMDPGKKDHQLGLISGVKLAKFEEGGLLMEYAVNDPQYQDLSYFACKFSPSLQVEWNTYLCSQTEKPKISLLTNSNYRDTRFDGKVLDMLVNTRDADLTAGNYREAMKGKEKILMHVRVGADGVRQAHTVFAFKDKPEMEDFHPYYIQHAAKDEYWFRFRQKKNTFTFGVIKRQ